MAQEENVQLDREEFSMQRAFLFALTIRSDLTNEVKAIVEKIERNLSKLADVKSHFEEQE